MANDRNWDRELAKIDELIDRMPAKEEPPRTPEGRALPPSGGPASPPVIRSDGPGPAPAAAATAPSRWARAGVWALATLAAAAAVALPFWPFGHRCGAELTVYLGAVAGTGVLGLATAVRAWRVRSGRAHIVGLLTLLSALALGTWEVLPRVGAALPTMERPAIWACE